MKVLVACEFSGIMRDAFNRVGCNAVSCDLEACVSSVPGEHIVGNVIDILDDGWDLMIAHPPCTYLCRAGARWMYEKEGWEEKQKDALNFVRTLWRANIPRICIENPVGAISTYIAPVTQIIEPWQHGHGETKKTCLWMKNLPFLKSTDIVEGRDNYIHNMPAHRDGSRGRKRSITYPGIAKAMAEQWGCLA